MEKEPVITDVAVMNKEKISFIVSGIKWRKGNEKMTDETKLILKKLDELDGKITDLKESLEKVEDRLTALEDRLEKVEDRLTVVEGRLSKVESRLTVVEDRLTVVEDRLTVVETRLTVAENKIADIQLTLENDLYKNIQIIAENHVDLTKKLDEALKIETEKELLSIRVNHLEDGLRKTNERVDALEKC